MQRRSRSSVLSLPKNRFWRWAVYGAFLLGAVGFFGGIAICFHYQLPIPPLFTTELGAFLGGCLGALAAWLSRAPARREQPSEQDGWYENTDLY
jgi:hypothetical protein